MHKFKGEWIFVLVLLCLGLSILVAFRAKEKEQYTLEKAQDYMKHHMWDSAKFHATHVLKAHNRKVDRSLANTIIALANDNIELEFQQKLEQRKAIFEKLDRVYKARDKTTWYRDPSTTRFENVPAFFLYMGEKSDEYWMKLRIQYSGENYLFMNSCQIDTDRKGYSFTPEGTIQRNHGEHMVWEWMDENYSESLYGMIHDIAYSDTSTIRYIGASSYAEREINQAEKDALKTMLNAYELRNVGQ